MELKIFIYWLILLIVFRIIAYIEYSMDNAVIYFKYYDVFLSGIYFFILALGQICIPIWLLLQFSSYFFTGDFVLIQ